MAYTYVQLVDKLSCAVLVIILHHDYMYMYKCITSFNRSLLSTSWGESRFYENNKDADQPAR